MGDASTSEEVKEIVGVEPFVSKFGFIKKQQDKIKERIIVDCKRSVTNYATSTREPPKIDDSVLGQRHTGYRR